jgi:hypothetical protein
MPEPLVSRNQIVGGSQLETWSQSPHDVHLTRVPVTERRDGVREV